VIDEIFIKRSTAIEPARGGPASNAGLSRRFFVHRTHGTHGDTALTPRRIGLH